jgi:hypothetical protein
VTSSDALADARLAIDTWNERYAQGDGIRVHDVHRIESD